MAALTLTVLVAGGTAIVSDFLTAGVTYKFLDHQKEKQNMSNKHNQNHPNAGQQNTSKLGGTPNQTATEEINNVAHELQKTVMLQGMACMLEKEGYTVVAPGVPATHKIKDAASAVGDGIAAAATAVKDTVVATPGAVADAGKGIGHFFTGLARSMKESVDSVVEKGK
jgi:hypothetical protein